MSDNDPAISPNTPMQDIIGQMNYQAATAAAGLNLSKQMNNQLSSVNMNVGKVTAAVNRLDATLVQMSNFQKATNMNIGRVVKSVDQTNKILTDMMRQNNNGKSSYDSVENTLESRNVSSNIQSMTNSLASIDSSLKMMLSGNQNTGGSSSSGWSGLASGLGAAAGGIGSAVAGGAAALYGLAGRNATKIMGAAGRGIGIGLADYGLGYAGVGQGQIDYAQDQRNWDRMSFMNKAESTLGRGIEYIGSWVAPNIANEATAARIRDETEYFRQQEARGVSMSPWASKDTLDNQQAMIEEKSKSMTTGDMLYEANDIVYKATNIRFEASSIQFAGAGQGQGSAGTGNRSSGYMSGGGTDAGGMFGGNPGGSGSNGVYGENGPTQQQLTSDQLTALGALEKSGSYAATGATNSLAGISDEVLKKSGVTVKHSPHGDYYSYTKPAGGGPTVPTMSGIGGPNGKKMDDVMNVLMRGDPKLGLAPMSANEAKYFMANFGSEGGFNGGVGDQGSVAGGSHNIGQWNRDRWDQGPNSLHAFAKKHGLDPNDVKTGALFTLWETQKGGFKDFYKKYKAAVASGDVEGAYDLLRDKYEVGMNGGSNRANFNATLGQISQGKLTQGQVGLAEGIQGNMPMITGGNGVMPTPGGAKVHEAYGPKRPGRPNEGIRNIGQVAATAAGMDDITYSSGLGNWNSSWIKKGGRTMHATGNALDAIGFESDEQKAAFIENAVAAGANGIGVYGDGSVHIDTGKFRSWAAANRKIYQDAIKRGMDRRKRGDIPGVAGQVKEAAKAAPDLAPSKDGIDMKKRSIVAYSGHETSEKQNYSINVGGGMGFQAFGEQHGAAQSIYTNREPTDEEMSQVNNWRMTTLPKLRGQEDYVMPVDGNSRAIQRTEALRREQARISDRKAKDAERRERIEDQRSHNKDAPGPKNPTATRREMDSVLGRHGDWYKQWSATV